ncbi:MAG: DUF839 domain-containing protein [Planctomycetota bacterium]
MKTDRRQFLRASAVTAAFFAFRGSLAKGSWRSPRDPANGYGDLVPDPKGLLDLPSGFEYRVFSKVGQQMDDGLLVPGAHDGMAAFPGPSGTTILIRNHELINESVELGPFGKANVLLEKVDRSRLYDSGGSRPSLGGTTTIVYDTKRREMVRHYLSLTGTERNCAGGPTPWGSWVTCEESVQGPDESHGQFHGYNFEVPASAQPRLAKPVPLKAMGRFNHEAIAVDPTRSFVYQTEDRPDGLFYRFIPEVPQRLERGGRLQALALRDRESADTRNWENAWISVGDRLPAKWIDLDEIDTPVDDLRLRGSAAGAARFARGEGLWASDEAIYFTCTSGGRNRHGQVWRYWPESSELELFAEPNDEAVLDYPDNLTVAPNGHLIVCEDGQGDEFLVGITPDGELYPFARNAMSSSEFAGATFSPDGSTLFANLQSLGLTLAITGPWKVS